MLKIKIFVQYDLHSEDIRNLKNKNKSSVRCRTNFCTIHKKLHENQLNKDHYINLTYTTYISYIPKVMRINEVLCFTYQIGINEDF